MKRIEKEPLARSSALSSPLKRIRTSMNGRENGLANEKQNPLDIPEIVEIVAAQISEYKDVKNMRSQSKAWRDETLSTWRDSAVFLINDETIPVLVKAFDESDLTGLSEEDKEEALSKKDPLRLCEVPFKKYRFGNRKGQPWTYPLEANDSEGNLIWEKVIRPHANYVDVGMCNIEQYTCKFRDASIEKCSPGLKWILSRCRGSLAMTPLQSDWVPDSGDVFVPPSWKRIGRNPFNDNFYMRSSLKPEITSFTISTPEQIPKGFKLLLEGSDLKNFWFGKFVIGTMAYLKQLKLPTGAIASSFIAGLNESANWIQLEHLTAFTSNENYVLYPIVLLKYFARAAPPMRELSVSLTSPDFLSIVTGTHPCLKFIQDTIVKLELEVTCEVRQDEENPSQVSTPPRFEFTMGACTFPNLTHFKVTQSYENAPRLGPFSLNHLKRMPKLEEFYFGIKNVQKEWVTETVQIVGDTLTNLDTLEFLKSFHFQGNFTTESLRCLGRITGQLETVEVVLDEENFKVVGEIWPRLRKLRLLEGSNVPEEFFCNLKTFNPHLNVL